MSQSSVGVICGVKFKNIFLVVKVGDSALRAMPSAENSPAPQAHLHG